MPPRTIRQFEVIDKIGEGGMGEVYRARDTNLQRIVAIKLLSGVRVADPEKQRRFLQEAQAASALNHPNIITVHDVASDNATYFIVMEHVKGKPLGELIPRKGMQLRDLLKVGIQVADALACAHAASIIHRDLKPSNIMVREDGLAKVLDFGLAKLIAEDTPNELESTRTAAITEEGTVVGTLSYMSPEQVESKKLDARTDIFSFGVVLFEMATGQRAFQGSSRVSTMSAILRDQPKWPEDRAAGLPVELERIINRCLRKDPERRYQTIKDVKIALEDIREDSESGRLNAADVSTSSTPPRRRVAPLLMTAVVIILALSAFAAWRFMPREREQVALELRPLTEDDGTTITPAIARDGKLVAYASDRAGDGGLDIWVQQLASGARPIRLTRDRVDETDPDFSPDGSMIAFQSEKDGGGIYVMPALGGDQRLVARGQFESPRFSPDGKWLTIGPPDIINANAFVVPVSGGAPRRIAEGFGEIQRPIWSPDGRYILFAGYIHKLPRTWWIVPAAGGTAVELGLENLERRPEAMPQEWIGDSVIFSDGDIKSVRIYSDPWRVRGPSKSLTASPAWETQPRAISQASNAGHPKVVFITGESNAALWDLPMSGSGARAAPVPAARMFADDTPRYTPSLSADGKRMAYIRFGLEHAEVRGRDMTTGSDRILMQLKSLPRARLSPDGSSIAINERHADENATVIDLVSWSSGETRRLCDSCGLIYDWSPDGKRVIYRSGKPMRISEINVATGRQRVIASDSKRVLASANLSPDERWTAIQYATSENVRPLYIAPVRDGVASAREKWITIMDRPGRHERPWWSPDGQTLYFLSSASGKVNIWAQRLNAANKTPNGEPFVVYVPPGERFHLYAGPQFGPALSPGRIMFQMIETKSNVWLGE